MGMGIRLSESDRTKFGCPEILDCEVADLTMLEAEAIQAQGGYSPEELLGGITTKPLLDAAGEPVLDKDGAVKTRRDWSAIRALVWLGLRRAGLEVPYAEFDFQMLRIKLVVADDPEPVVPGKDPFTPPSDADISAT